MKSSLILFRKTYFLVVFSEHTQINARTHARTNIFFIFSLCSFSRSSTHVVLIHPSTHPSTHPFIPSSSWEEAGVNAAGIVTSLYNALFFFLFLTFFFQYCPFFFRGSFNESRSLSFSSISLLLVSIYDGSGCFFCYNSVELHCHYEHS